MATLANLVVRINGNTASLNKAVTKAEGRLKKFKAGASKALKAVGKVAKGLAAGGALAISWVCHRRRQELPQRRGRTRQDGEADRVHGRITWGTEIRRGAIRVIH